MANLVAGTYTVDLGGVLDAKTFSDEVTNLFFDDVLVTEMAAQSVTATFTQIGGQENSAPVADAGPGQTVLLGATVTLHGSASSDADGDALT